MLEGGSEVLAASVDKDKRTGLHYASGIGSAEAVKMLVEAGSKVDAGDKDGYTPLHIAAGYMHADVVKELVAAGADVEKEDKTGRSPLNLVNNLKQNMGNDPMTLTRRMLLEDVAKVLEDAVYDEVEPKGVTAVREKEGFKQYLCEWYDGADPMWLDETLVADDIIEDFEGGVEYADAEAVEAERRDKAGRVQYLVRWSDGEPSTWEPKANVCLELVAQFEAQQQGTAALAGEESAPETAAAQQVPAAV